MRYQLFPGVNAGVLCVPVNHARPLLQPACNPPATERSVRRWCLAALAGTSRHCGLSSAKLAWATAAGPGDDRPPGLLAGRLGSPDSHTRAVYGTIIESGSINGFRPILALSRAASSVGGAPPPPQEPPWQVVAVQESCEAGKALNSTGLSGLVFTCSWKRSGRE